MRRVAHQLLTALVIAASITPGVARKLEFVNAGDADEALYRALVTAAFDYLEDYECLLDKTGALEGFEGYTEKHGMEAASSALVAGCQFAMPVCFPAGETKTCFDHGGYALVRNITLADDEASARLNLLYTLNGEENAVAGTGFATMDLAKEDAGWLASNWRATGVIERDDGMPE